MITMIGKSGNVLFHFFFSPRHSLTFTDVFLFCSIHSLVFFFLLFLPIRTDNRTQETYITMLCVCWGEREKFQNGGQTRGKRQQKRGSKKLGHKQRRHYSVMMFVDVVFIIGSSSIYGKMQEEDDEGKNKT